MYNVLGTHLNKGDVIVDWNYVSGLVNFIFEDMFMSGFWNTVWNSFGVGCMVFLFIYAIYGIFFRKADEE